MHRKFFSWLDAKKLETEVVQEKFEWKIGGWRKTFFHPPNVNTKRPVYSLQVVLY